MAMLLVFSAVESLACGLQDTQNSHISFVPDGDNSDSKALADVCIHGHSHHVPAALPAAERSPQLLSWPVLVTVPCDATVYSRSVATLERPPKRA